jgi:hypothetical protein
MTPNARNPVEIRDEVAPWWASPAMVLVVLRFCPSGLSVREVFMYMWQGTVRSVPCDGEMECGNVLGTALWGAHGLDARC